MLGCGPGPDSEPPTKHPPVRAVLPFARVRLGPARHIIDPMAVIQSRLTVARKDAFLAELTKHGIVARAARAASPHSSGGCVMTFESVGSRDRVDAEFAGRGKPAQFR